MAVHSARQQLTVWQLTVWQLTVLSSSSLSGSLCGLHDKITHTNPYTSNHRAMCKEDYCFCKVGECVAVHGAFIPTSLHCECFYSMHALHLNSTDPTY